MIRRPALFLLGVSLAALGSAEGQSSDPRDILCQRGYSASLRLPYAEYRVMRDAAFARAGISTSQQCHRDDTRTECYILDHVIPLELCLDHCNDPANLQIQLRADAEAKDKTENSEHVRYCRGETTLEDAWSHFRRSTK